ncbi:hypothetical protein PCASD_24655 [Puccinia coronata f. sp. avenae]|uniref:ATP-dependent DNA helicase sgs1 n=1 Tax=Puccinia coronata f. sp. avenae TaxID=200324 RepID=A0A2N5SDV9_9BASI|nr:hypothetical protein PCASD_24655 [Puccinia coronata f. sp. avenae]
MSTDLVNVIDMEQNRLEERVNEGGSPNEVIDPLLIDTEMVGGEDCPNLEIGSNITTVIALNLGNLSVDHDKVMAGPVPDKFTKELASQISCQSKKTQISLTKKILVMDQDTLAQCIVAQSEAFFGNKPKPLQLEAVISLVRDRNTFVLAGTGFGKSRIAELYFNLYPAYKRRTILVLNPLDSLGDNQVHIL